MKRCECGNTNFIGHQVQSWLIEVYDNGFTGPEFLGAEQCYDAEKPFGPFCCTECNAEYGEWEDIPDATTKENKPE